MASKDPMLGEQSAFRKHGSRYEVLTTIFGCSPLRARNVTAGIGRLETAPAHSQHPPPHRVAEPTVNRRQRKIPAVAPTIPNAVNCCQSTTP